MGVSQPKIVSKHPVHVHVISGGLASKVVFDWYICPMYRFVLDTKRRCAMTKPVNVLTTKVVKDARPGAAPYRLVDGGGLFLLVNRGSKLWRLNHNDTTKALGAYPAISLAKARAQRDAAKLAIALIEEAPKDLSPTFRAAAAEWHAAQTNWSSTNQRIVWRLLDDKVFPAIGDMQMAQISKPLICETVVKPFEQKGVIERGERAIGYIRKIYDWVNTRSDTLLPDFNPARNIKFVSRKPTVSRAALTDLAAVRDMLRAVEAAPKHPGTALANRMMALTAMRSYAIRRAEYGQFKLEGDCPVWDAPAAVMKGSMGTRRPLTIPLSPQAVEVVRAARRLSNGKYLFPGRELNSKMSENTLLFALDDAGFHGIHSPHGWRSTFSTIMSERHPAETNVIGFALGHKPAGVAGIYNRAEYLERRRELAVEYADLLLEGFCPAADLLAIRKR